MQQHQQQQQLGAPAGHPMMGPMAGAVPPTSITTEQIQKYLDENKQLILAILDNQNLGKLSECAQYQALLQKNLLYLAAIADAQPQSPAMRPQMIPHPATPQGSGQFMQAGAVFPSATPVQFTPQQLQEWKQQQLQHSPQMMPFPGHMAMRSVGVMNGMHAVMHAESSRGGGSNELSSGGGGNPGSSADVRGSKQDTGTDNAATAAAADSQKQSASEQGNENTDQSSLTPKRPESSKTP